MKKLTFATMAAMAVAAFCSPAHAVAQTNYAEAYKGLSVNVKPVEAPSFPDNRIVITELGAKGDGLTLCTEAVKKSISKLT